MIDWGTPIVHLVGGAMACFAVVYLLNRLQGYSFRERWRHIAGMTLGFTIVRVAAEADSFFVLFGIATVAVFGLLALLWREQSPREREYEEEQSAT